MNKRILIIEDDHTCETVLRRIIRSICPNAVIDWRESGEGAIQLLNDESKNKTSYDLIIADIFLSGEITGIELWQACHGSFPNTPILITSSMAINQFFEAIGREVVTPPYLSKPFFVGECRQIIEGLLTHPGSSQVA